jgi:hypothetical protein
MTATLNAVFDGEVLRPEEPLALPPNTRVRITVETPGHEERQTGSFLQTAEALKLDGPPDWSSRLEEYLYTHRVTPDG